MILEDSALKHSLRASSLYYALNLHALYLPAGRQPTVRVCITLAQRSQKIIIRQNLLTRILASDFCSARPREVLYALC